MLDRKIVFRGPRRDDLIVFCGIEILAARMVFVSGAADTVATLELGYVTSIKVREQLEVWRTTKIFDHTARLAICSSDSALRDQNTTALDFASGYLNCGGIFSS